MQGVDNILSLYIERYRAWGLCLIPIIHKDKVPAVRWQQYQKRQPDEAELATWFSTNTTNIAIVCGGISGNFVALDFDDLDLYMAFADYWHQFYGKPVQEMTLIVQTGGGNHHVYVKVKEKPPLFHPVGEQRKLIPDIQSEGGYVLAPPSIHPSGNPYRFLNDVSTIHEVESLEELAIDIPKTKTYPAASGKKPPVSQEANELALTELVESCAFIRHCQDDAPQLSETEWWTLIHQLVPFGEAGEELAHKFSQPYPGYSEEETTRKVEYVKAAQVGDDGVGPHTCEYIQTTYGFECPPDCVAIGLRASSPVSMATRLATQEKGTPIGPAETSRGDGHCEWPDRYPLTDLGNAERLVRRHGQNIRYCYERKQWLVWNGHMWAWDFGSKVLQLAKETARAILAEAATEEDDAKRKELVGHARKSEAENRLNAMVNLARSEAGITITTKGLNRNNWLFNCKNGAVDLRTGQLRPHQREDYITITAPVEYHQNARDTSWEIFMNRATNGNDDLMGFLKRCAGMSLTGDTSAQVMLFPYGFGDNAKTTYLMAMYHVMGGYAAMAEPDSFMVDSKNRSGPNENLANLYGKRLVISTEVEEGRKLSVARVKAMTGGEEIQASRKYEHEITWKPTHTLWLSGNHKPIITDTTHSIWRRVKLIPFTVTIPEDEKIEGLAEILALNAGPAILSWMVEGCLEWQGGGLREPQTVRVATAEYRGEMDLLAPFLEDCCVIAVNEDVTVKELYAAYTRYCEEGGERYMGKKKFGERLREKGFDQAKRADAHYWIGIALKDEIGDS